MLVTYGEFGSFDDGDGDNHGSVGLVETSKTFAMQDDFVSMEASHSWQFGSLLVLLRGAPRCSCNMRHMQRGSPIGSSGRTNSLNELFPVSSMGGPRHSCHM